MIPNQWYAVIRGQDVKNKPVGITRLNKKLVLYRDSNGEVACLEDRCAHKGVLLSKGKQHGDAIACPYHGFQYNQQGKCVHMPVLGKCGVIPRTMQVPAYKVHEQHGLIWLWNGEQQDSYPEVPMFANFAEYKGFTSLYGWTAPIHYTRYVESVCEVYHVPFVHKGSFLNIWDPKGGRVDDFRCAIDGHLITSDFILRPDDERPAQDTLTAKFPWQRGWRIGVDVLMPNLVQIRNDVFDVYLVATPIDDENTWVCFCYQEPKKDLLFPFFKPLPIPLWRQLRPWMMCRMERFIQQAKDLEAIEGQWPRASSLSANNLIPVDKVNAYYLRLRDKLIREAEAGKSAQSKAPAVPIHLVTEPAGSALETNSL